MGDALDSLTIMETVPEKVIASFSNALERLADDKSAAQEYFLQAVRCCRGCDVTTISSGIDDISKRVRTLLDLWPIDKESREVGNAAIELFNILYMAKVSASDIHFSVCVAIGDFQLRAEAFVAACHYFTFALFLCNSNLSTWGSTQLVEVVEKRVSLVQASFLYAYVDKIVQQLLFMRTSTKYFEILRTIESMGDVFAYCDDPAAAKDCYNICLQQVHSASLLATEVIKTEFISRIVAKSNSYHQDAKVIKSLYNSHREDLASIRRNAFESNPFASTQQRLAAFSMDLSKLLQNLLLEVSSALGPSPVRYAIISLGSLARSEASPYSDWECALLLEDNFQDIHLSYFQHFIQYLELKLISFGEDDRLIAGMPSGLRFDCRYSPVGSSKLIYPVSTLASSYLKLDQIERNLFTESEFLFGSKDLSLQWDNQLADVLNNNDYRLEFARELIIDHLHANKARDRIVSSSPRKFSTSRGTALMSASDMNISFGERSENETAPTAAWTAKENPGLNLNIDKDFPDPPVVREADSVLGTLRVEVEFGSRNTVEDIANLHIKESLLRFPVLLLHSLSLYFNLSVKNSIDRIDALVAIDKMSSPVAIIFRIALTLGMKWRCRSQLAHKREYDVIEVKEGNQEEGFESSDDVACFKPDSLELHIWSHLRELLSQLLPTIALRFALENDEMAFMRIEDHEMRNIAKFLVVCSNACIQYSLETSGDGSHLRLGNYFEGLAMESCLSVVEEDFDAKLCSYYLENANCVNESDEDFFRQHEEWEVRRSPAKPDTVDDLARQSEQFVKRESAANYMYDMIKLTSSITLFPEFPGVAYASTTLANLITGHTASISTVKRFTKGVPALVSKASFGESLQDAMAEDTDILKSVDPENYSLHFLRTLVLLPEREGPEDFILVESLDKPEIVGAKTIRKLVCINNDRTFCPPTRGTTFLSVQVKSIILCSEMMDNVIHPNVAKRIVNLDVENIVRKWLDLIVLQDEMNRYSFNFDELSQTSPDGRKCTVPTCLPDDVGISVYYKLKLIQSCLGSSSELTHNDLLNIVEPSLFNAYSSAFATVSKAVSSASSEDVTAAMPKSGLEPPFSEPLLSPRPSRIGYRLRRSLFGTLHDQANDPLKVSLRDANLSVSAKRFLVVTSDSYAVVSVNSKTTRLKPFGNSVPGASNNVAMEIASRHEISNRIKYSPKLALDRLNAELPDGWSAKLKAVRQELLSLRFDGYFALANQALRQEVLFGTAITMGTFETGIEFGGLDERTQVFLLGLLCRPLPTTNFFNFRRVRQQFTRLVLCNCSVITLPVVLDLIHASPCLAYLDIRNCIKIVSTDIPVIASALYRPHDQAELSGTSSTFVHSFDNQMPALDDRSIEKVEDQILDDEFSVALQDIEDKIFYVSPPRDKRYSVATSVSSKLLVFSANSTNNLSGLSISQPSTLFSVQLTSDIETQLTKVIAGRATTAQKHKAIELALQVITDYEISTEFVDVLWGHVAREVESSNEALQIISLKLMCILITIGRIRTQREDDIAPLLRICIAHNDAPVRKLAAKTILLLLRTKHKLVLRVTESLLIIVLDYYKEFSIDSEFGEAVLNGIKKCSTLNVSKAEIVLEILFENSFLTAGEEFKVLRVYLCDEISKRYLRVLSPASVTSLILELMMASQDQSVVMQPPDTAAGVVMVTTLAELANSSIENIMDLGTTSDPAEKDALIFEKILDSVLISMRDSRIIQFVGNEASIFRRKLLIFFLAEIGKRGIVSSSLVPAVIYELCTALNLFFAQCDQNCVLASIAGLNSIMTGCYNLSSDLLDSITNSVADLMRALPAWSDSSADSNSISDNIPSAVCSIAFFSVKSSFICLRSKGITGNSCIKLMTEASSVFKFIVERNLLLTVPELDQRLAIRFISYCLLYHTGTVVEDILNSYATMLDTLAGTAFPSGTRYDALLCIRTRLFTELSESCVSWEEKADVDNKVATLTVEMLAQRTDTVQVQSGLWMIGNWTETIGFPQCAMQKVCEAVILLIEFPSEFRHAALATLHLLIVRGQFPPNLSGSIINIVARTNPIDDALEFGLLLQMADVVRSQLDSKQFNLLLDAVIVYCRLIMMADIEYVSASRDTSSVKAIAELVHQLCGRLLHQEHEVITTRMNEILECRNLLDEVVNPR